MALLKPKDHFLTLSRRQSPWAQAPATDQTGDDGIDFKALADQRLADYADQPAAAAQASPQAKKKDKDKSKDGEKFIDKPLTLRRSWKLKALCLSPALLLGIGALADKYSGGAVMLHTVDASVGTADYLYRNISGSVNVDDAVEWGIAIAQPLKFLHTDPAALWTKNEAALQARQKHGDDAAKIKNAVLPVVIGVDFKNFTANYTLRNVITLRNYPDMAEADRGRLLARGFLRDVHVSFAAATELDGITLSDDDILTFMERRPDVLRRLPRDLRGGLATLIADMRATNPDTERTHGTSGLQDWQIRALEAAVAAEMGPPESPEAKRQREEDMDRAMREFEESRRPKTLGELMREKQQGSGATPPSATAPRATPPLRDALRGAATRTREQVAAATPTPWRSGWCYVKSSVVSVRYDKCLMGQ